MSMFHRKTWWERALEPVVDRVDAGALAKSGLTTLASALGVAVASAAVSAARRKEVR
jgi:hypothetical protein